MSLATVPAVEAIIEAYDDANRPANLFAVGAKLSAERIAMKDKGATAEQDLAVFIEMLIFMLDNGFARSDDPWNSYFRPQSSWEIDGKSVFAPDIFKVPSDAISHWERRAETLKNLTMKARYADVVWEFASRIDKDKKRDPRMAAIAIDAYVGAVKGNLAGDYLDSFVYVTRAIDLAASIRDSKRLDDARGALLDLHRLTKLESTGMWWPRAYDHLVSHKTAGATEAEMAELVQDLEDALARYSDVSSQTFNPHDTQSAAERLAKHYIRLKKPEDVKRVNLILAKALEHFASLGNAMLASSFLQDSIYAYQAAGLPEEVERVRILMEKKILASRDEMTTFTHETQIPKEAVEQFLNELLDDEIWQTLANIAVKFLPRSEQLKAQNEKMAKEAPLFSMLTQQIMAEGHIAASVGGLNDDPHGRLVLAANQNMTFNTQWLLWGLDAAIKKFELTSEHFTAWANRKNLFEDDRVNLLREGLEAWFRHDYIKSLHVLIPQIEHAVRALAGKVGKPITKPSGKIKGVSVAINMGDVMYSDETIAAIGPMGSAIKLYFLALYIDPRGRNLRNEFAHGLLGPGDIGPDMLLWVVHTLLLLGLWEPQTSADSGGAETND